ncbi:hypothetical protein HUG15_00320 [Salicibibacter cibarius]|uniref:TOTE conflict system primase domain-containing protein n=1 Tax=Salicibibacter cibarius TaxID=2743000 RepID=A0A7T6YZU4_9BACI|nr:hypothetical protein [Salicibibacter cibarius]QQK74213.1 hypothetical protein HUG15_00320 [Salicibibacter cibarius]
MAPTKTDNQKPIIKKLNDFYIQTRRKYLVQLTEGKYITLNKDRMENVFYLNDGMIKRHLNGDLTYGIFAGGYFNKFISFDVDCETRDAARWATLRLIYVLTEEFNIMRGHIHVSLSGNKGYHVDLFFNKPIAIQDLKAFYTTVIQEVGEVPNGEIEFRPSWSQGVKLPLGVHQKTGRRCWFVDTETLEPIKRYDYILDIEPMPADTVTDQYFDLSDEQAAEFEHVVESTDITANVADYSAGLKRATRILDAGQLLESNSRHHVTFDLAKFFHSQGYEGDEAVTHILTVLHNTPRDYFHSDSTPDFWRREAERITALVFDRGYTFGNTDQPIVIHKSEILAVLSCGTFKTKQLLYAMLVTSKRYGKSFYLTAPTARKMLGTKSNETVTNALKRLADGGFIEYTRKGEIDVAMSRDIGRPRYKPNKYRLLIDEPAADEPSVQVTQEQSVVEVAFLLCDPAEIKQYVKRREYENQWQ